MNNSYCKTICLAALLLLASCGAPPTIRSSETTVGISQKISSIRLLYRDVELTQSNNTLNSGYIPVGSLGFAKFGDKITSVAPQVLAPYGLTVSAVSVVSGNQVIISAIRNGYRLVITPVAAKLSQSGNALWASHAFSCEVINESSGQSLWKAILDTRTFRPQVESAPGKTEFDEAYARQFLQSIADRLKKDGLI